MSHLLTLITGISLLGLLILAGIRARSTKNWRLFGIQTAAILLFALFLHAILGFPVPQPDASARGGSSEISFVIILYAFMLLGMLAQYGFHFFEKPKAKREPFDIGRFLAPVFASPIIFVPLLAALQNANLDLTALDAPRLMLFLVAFENGFFWKDYFDQRRKNIARGEKDRVAS